MLLLAAPARTATYAGGLAEAEVVFGVDGPTSMARTPDGRVLVAQQTGEIRVVKNGALLAAPAAALTVDSRSERGLIGIAVDPQFVTQPYVYVHYTTPGPPARNRVSRLTMSGDAVVPGSEVVLLDMDALGTPLYHNGGTLLVGGDGRLYVATGDNGQQSAVQRLDSTHGKVLRINRDGTIPTDNPFYATATGIHRSIYALGLRNPYSGAVDRVTGRIFINDVGQNSWEEVDELAPGANYGWPLSEGPTTTPGQTSPLHAYSSAADNPGFCAITGGTFYDAESPSFPADHAGDYLFADHCAGVIRRLDLATNAVTDLGTGVGPGIVGMLTEPGGDVLYLTRNLGWTAPDPAAPVGKLMRIVNTAAPVIAAQPQDVVATVGEPAAFQVQVSGTAAVSYQWQRDGEDIPGAISSSYTLASPQLADDGARFRCRVTGPNGSALTREARLTVTANRAPAPAITAPEQGLTYAGGDVIAYSGAATDPEDGTLPESAFTWRVDLHHDDHTHPFVPDTPGARSGTFTIPTTGETSANVFYRVYLTVTDSGGRSATTFVDVRPRVVRMSLATDPPGLQVVLDGQPVTTPLAVDTVIGVERTIAALSPQRSGGRTWTFTSWADGGAPSRVVTPAADTTYTARHVESAWVESAGQVVMEAERNDENITRGGRAWTPVTTPAGFAGSGAMQVLPNTGGLVNAGFATTAPQMRFSVRFQTPGTYQVWARVWAPATTDDSLHVGLDGAEVASADRITTSALGAWTWTRATADGVNATLTVPAAGTRTVDVWMREDGLILDRIMLTTSTAATPAGTGPAASPRTDVTDTVAPTITARLPAPGATAVPVGDDVRVTFSEPVAAASVTASTVRLVRVSDGGAVTATRTLADGGTTVVLAPAAALEASTTYRVETGAVTDLAGNAATAASWTFTTAAAGAPPAWLESGGQVVIEAEAADETIARGGRSWSPVTSPAGFAGTGAIQALPNSGGNVNTGFASTSPQARHRVRFVTPGTYQVWVRAWAASTGDDSLHAGLDGAEVAGADRITGSVGAWTWMRATMDGPNATIPVPAAGTRTLDLWMREDGLVVDRVLLTTSTTFTPTGSGPAASPRGDVADTLAPVVTTRVPAPAATGVGVGDDVRVTFSEPVAAASVTASTVRLVRVSDGAAVDAARTLADGGTTVVLDPAAALDGSSTYRVETGAVTDVAGNPAAATSWTFTTAAATALAWVESGGQVVIEAEQADENIPRAGRAWNAVTTPTGHTGTGAMQALPNTGGLVNTGFAGTTPQMRFRIRFTTTGTYQVWMRMRATATTDDSLHAGLDNTETPSADRIWVQTYNTWTWTRTTADAVNATITIPTPGTRTLEVWMREDGAILDRSLLTRASTTPTGTGPPASPRG